MKKVIKQKRLLWVIAGVVISLLLACCFACDNLPEKPDDGTSPEEELSAICPDLHVKVDDSTFDFLSYAPEGVTIEYENVYLNVAGAQKIYYVRDGVRIEKTIYIYGAPLMKKDNADVSESYELSYFDANSLDFLDATDVGIVATDYFGTQLNVTANSTNAYAGEYGTYVYTYTATDRVGNVITKTVSYVITGETAPTVTPAQFDVIDDTATVNVSLTQDEQNSLLIYLDGEYVPASNYTVSNSGIVFDGAYLSQLFDDTANLRIATARWYVDTTVTMVDNADPVFDDLTIKDYIYESGETITLPVPQKTYDKQSFTFGYEVLGSATITATIGENNTVILTNSLGGAIPAGEYTLKVNGLRGSEVKVTKQAPFTVLSTDDWNRTIAPTNTDQFLGDFEAGHNIWAQVVFDSEMNAYKVQRTEGNEEQDIIDGYSGIRVKNNTEVLNKITDNIGNYEYFVMDIYLTAQIGVDFNAIVWNVATKETSTSTTQFYLEEMKVYNESEEVLSGTIERFPKEQWLTVYIGVAGEEHSNRIINDNSGGCNIMYMQYTGEQTFSPYYVRNIA